MKKNEVKLLSSRAVNKIGNVMYDYGNSTWIATMGSVGKTYMAYYQIVENLIALIFNPFGGAIADRFKRRKILITTDVIGGIMCAALAIVGNKDIMLYGLIAVNAVLALMHAFSGTSFKSYVVTVVEKDRLVIFNSRLEAISQIVSVSSPIFAFLFVDRFGLRPTLAFDSATFFLSSFFIFLIKEEEKHVEAKVEKASVKAIWRDIKEGMLFIVKEKEIFFLLVIASFVNFFIAAFNYIAPFSVELFHNDSSFAFLLSMGAVGAIAGAVLADKLFKNTYRSILLALAMCGVGLGLISLLALLKLPAIVIASGNGIFSFFLTIFNIHFFSMVQRKVPDHMLGRAFSSIFTVAVVFMPISTEIMKLLPFSIHVLSFAVIGGGILMVSIIASIIIALEIGKR